jgi:hypothetical protein
MAILKAEGEFEFKEVAELAEMLPDFNGRYLAFLGSRARKLLKMNYLSGQELQLRKFPVDTIGRNTITSDVNKKQTETKVYSYPVNLFEKGRMLRDGTRQEGKFIITRKLKQDVMMNVTSYTNEFETRFLQGDLNKI